MKKFVIYSAVVGCYDAVQQPVVIDDRFDYILFSNDYEDKQIGVWQIQPIEYTNNDSTRICRYVKTHPEELLKNYEVSIWIDSNIQILTSDFYEKVINLYNSKTLISSMWHPARTCIYDEAFAVINMLVEHESIVLDWCHKLRVERYPRNIGLFETNVFYRLHKDAYVLKFDRLWWYCIDHHSRRDQLSCNYALWKLGIPVVYLLGEGKNARNTNCLQLVEHNDKHHNHCPIAKNEAWLMRYCWKDRSKTNEIKELYYHLCALPFPSFWAVILGQIYRLKYLFEHHG